MTPHDRGSRAGRARRSTNDRLVFWLVGGLAALAAAGLVAGEASVLYREPPYVPPTDRPPPNLDPARSALRLPTPPVRFTDVTREAGLRFTHVNGAFGKHLLPETMGAGVAVLDYDNDGKPDLLFVNSCYWPGREPKGGAPPTLALYHNLGGGRFEDVTEAAGLAVSLYGMGVTVGDYDNDGWPDLFVTGVGGNRLFHNEPRPGGGRRFRDVTAAAGVAGPGGWPTGGGDFLSHKAPLSFCTSASFLDYDGDGLLDLFVCGYVNWSPDYDLRVNTSADGRERTFGPPTTFEGSQCFLYHNLGGGRFEDVSARAGIEVFEKDAADEAGRGRPAAKALGVVVADVDDDGWPDILVANDGTRNFLFHNVARPDGGRGFEEIGRQTGLAYAQGQARRAAGVDWAWDYRPGWHAAVLGKAAGEPATLLCLDVPRQLLFTDHAVSEGVGAALAPLQTFGALFLDYDLDGRLDLLTCNGGLDPAIDKVRAFAYRQPAQLFWNSGRQPTCFEPATAEAVGPDLFRGMVGRGCAYADIDGDGALDLILTGNGEPARLLRNEGGTGRHWVRLNLRGDGVHSNRSAIGARIILEADGVRQQREVAAARGYLSCSELTATFGLADARKIDRVTIRWPGRNAGPPRVLTDLSVDRVYTIDQAAPRP